MGSKFHACYCYNASTILKIGRRDGKCEKMDDD